MPLNCDVSRMRVISSVSCVTSRTIAFLSSVASVPLAYWTGELARALQHRVDLGQRPSAVWTSEMPSCVLRRAWLRPPI